LAAGLNDIFFLFCGQMSDAAPTSAVADSVTAVMDAADSAPGWLGPILGGSVLSAVSAAGSFAIEKKAPTVKTLGRDFILGAIFFLLISQLLPESTGKLLAAAFALFTISIPSSSSTPATSLLEEMEVRVGVPQF